MAGIHPLTAILAISIGLSLSDDGLVSNIAEFALSCLTHGGYVSVACANWNSVRLSHRVPHHSYCLGVAAERTFARYERHITPCSRLVVVALTDANGRWGIIQMPCNPNDFFWHQWLLRGSSCATS
jgi:hypothetical protein